MITLLIASYLAFSVGFGVGREHGRDLGYEEAAHDEFVKCPMEPEE